MGDPQLSTILKSPLFSRVKYWFEVFVKLGDDDNLILVEYLLVRKDLIGSHIFN